MVTLTPPSSNSGTPARPTTPPAEHAQGMDVDSVPHSPLATPGGAAAPAAAATPTEHDAAEAPVPAAKAEDTEDDEDAPRKSRGGKTREMFDSDIVERWNRQIGDIFTTPVPAAMPGMVPP